MAPPDNDVLWARGLVKSYDVPRGGGPAPGPPALRGVSLGVRDGEILAVVGPRGSGKTTLLRCLSGQLLPDEGEVWFHSRPVHTLGPAGRERLRRERFGWIGPEPQLVPGLSGRENAALPLLLAGIAVRAARVAALEWLERLDAADCARLTPDRMSQAQRQRVAVARSLVGGPTVLFADEPTAPLHHEDRGQVLRTLTAVGRSHGITVVLATSDDEVASCADRAVALLDGRRAGGPPQLAAARRAPASRGVLPQAAANGSKSADRCSASA
ncbi:ATP-binding cassette domain-containing protein [Streptomyces capparidis]